MIQLSTRQARKVRKHATEKECAGLRAENEGLQALRLVQAELIAELERKLSEQAQLISQAVDRVHGSWGAAVNSLAPGMFEVGRKIEGSARARKAAKLKNDKPRAWVLSEWNKRTDKGQSKASFARQYAPMVKKRFPNDPAGVTAETIARDWLPKAKN